MDILYRRGKATVGEILEEIPDPPSYSAVRAMLRVLEDKKVFPTRSMSSTESCLRFSRKKYGFRVWQPR